MEAKLPSVCPSCSAGLTITGLGCENCDMRLECKLSLPPLLRLSQEDIEFTLEFVRCSGSLKELAKRRGKSYPTIRNRLNRIIEELNAAVENKDARRKRILDGIASGDLDVAAATQMLKEVGR